MLLYSFSSPCFPGQTSREQAQNVQHISVEFNELSLKENSEPILMQRKSPTQTLLTVLIGIGLFRAMGRDIETICRSLGLEADTD